MMRKVFILFLTLSILINCHTVEVIDDTKANLDVPNKSTERWYASFLFGIIELEPKKGTSLNCKFGVSKVKMEYSDLNFFVELVSYLAVAGLISPMIVSFNTNKTYCLAENPNQPKKEQLLTPTQNKTNEKKNENTTDLDNIAILKDGTILSNINLETIEEFTIIIDKNGKKKITITKVDDTFNRILVLKNGSILTDLKVETIEGYKLDVLFVKNETEKQKGIDNF